MKKINLLFGLAAILVAQAVFAEESDAIRVQYKVGEGTYVGDGGNNLFHLQGRFQGRLTYTSIEGGRDTAGFNVPRAEIRMDGFTLEKKLKYAFEMNLATRNRATTAVVCTNAACTTTATAVTAESTSGLATLNDYYVDWVASDALSFQVGQFKVPFLIQQLTSSTRLQFIDRGLSTGFFDFGRDIGLTAHGSLVNDKLQYNVFAMNGEGANNLNRNARSLMLGTRLEFPLLGTYEYSECDPSNSEGQNLGFALAYAFNENAAAIQNNTIAAFTKAHHGTFDMGYKHKGLSVQNALMVTRTIEGNTINNFGYNAQVGYFFIPKIIEGAVKTGGVIFDNLRNQYEYAVAFNYFPMGKGHGVKFQTDYTLLVNDGGAANINDHRIRTAMNLIF